MKLRIVIAILCVICAIVLCFVVSPLLNKKANEEISIIVCKNDISKGSEIKKDDIEILKVFSKNIPADYVRKESDIISYFAKEDLKKGDFISKNSISKDIQDGSPSLYSLKDGECAYSIPVQNISNGVGNNLSVGDKISIIVNVNNESFIPQTLKNLTILSLNTSQGKTKGDSDMYSCITIKMNEEQATLLSSYQKHGSISVILNSKGQGEK